jgi:ankyrin repeat protein
MDTALHAAAGKGCVDVTAKLIDLGCDMNKTDNIGLTALHFAAGTGHVDVVAKLIELEDVT